MNDHNVVISQVTGTHAILSPKGPVFVDVEMASTLSLFDLSFQCLLVIQNQKRANMRLFHVSDHSYSPLKSRKWVTLNSTKAPGFRVSTNGLTVTTIYRPVPLMTNEWWLFVPWLFFFFFWTVIHVFYKDDRFHRFKNDHLALVLAEYELTVCMSHIHNKITLNIRFGRCLLSVIVDAFFDLGLSSLAWCFFGIHLSLLVFTLIWLLLVKIFLCI